MSDNKFNYKSLSRNGLINLCTDYDESTDGALNEFALSQEKEHGNDFQRIDAEGYVIPIYYETRTGFDEMSDTIKDLKEASQEISNSVKDHMTLINNCVKAVMEEIKPE